VHSDQIQLLPRLRARKGLHYAVTAVTTVALLVVYYGHANALSTKSSIAWDWFWSVFFFEFRNAALGLLLLVPLLYAAITLGWKKLLIVMVVLVSCITPYVLHFAYETYVIFTSLSFIVIPPILMMSIEVKLISDARERLAREQKKRERAEVVRQLLLAQEDERKRISQELHDGVAQTLLVTATVAHNLLESVAVLDGAMRTDLETVKGNSLGLVAEIRAICQDLRPSILDNLGLVSAIKWLLDDMQDEMGAAVELRLSGQVYAVGPEESLAVFRVVQEALNNVNKHAEASSVRVALTFAEEGIAVDVEDDGRGFKVEDDPNLFALSGRLGLLGMSERAQAIGGKLQIESSPGLGTRISISVDRKAQSTSVTHRGEEGRPAAEGWRRLRSRLARWEKSGPPRS